MKCLNFYDAKGLLVLDKRNDRKIKANLQKMGMFGNIIFIAD